MIYKFYDTCSLLAKVGHLWDDDNEQIIISSTTLNELENIKTSTTKDAETKYATRKLLQELNDHPHKYTVSFWRESYLNFLEQSDFKITNDIKIILSAKAFFGHLGGEQCVFVTNDLHCKMFATQILQSCITIESYYEEPYAYKGYKEIQMNDEEMANMYSNLENNPCDLMVNEYLLVKDAEGNIVDKMCWTGERLRPVQYFTFNSSWFGDVKPIKGDPYQTLVADSLMNNKITMIKGPAGSGKSYLSLSYLFHRMEKGKIDKIVIFCNTVAANNAARLGLAIG